MNTQEQQQTQADWDKIAPGYDKTNTPTQMWLGNEGLRRAELRPGMRFLDVAAAAAPSVSRQRVSARGCWRRTNLPPCSTCSRHERARSDSTSKPM